MYPKAARGGTRGTNTQRQQQPNRGNARGGRQDNYSSAFHQNLDAYKRKNKQSGQNEMIWAHSDKYRAAGLVLFAQRPPTQALVNDTRMFMYIYFNFVINTDRDLS